MNLWGNAREGSEVSTQVKPRQQAPDTEPATVTIDSSGDNLANLLARHSVVPQTAWGRSWSCCRFSREAEATPALPLLVRYGRVGSENARLIHAIGTH